MPGIPRATYMPYPFRIVQGDGDILFVYEFASANRIVHMSNHQEAPVDSWMGWSNGRWDGDTLVIEVTGNNDQTWFDRAGNHHGAPDQGHGTLHADGRRITFSTKRPSRIRRRSRGHGRSPCRCTSGSSKNVQLLEFKCVEFSEELLYGDLTKKSE